MIITEFLLLFYSYYSMSKSYKHQVFWYIDMDSEYSRNLLVFIEKFLIQDLRIAIVRLSNLHNLRLTCELESQFIILLVLLKIQPNGRSFNDSESSWLSERNWIKMQNSKFYAVLRFFNRPFTIEYSIYSLKTIIFLSRFFNLI